MNAQHNAEAEVKYLQRKLDNLQIIYNGYMEEKKAWEENMDFFSHPVSLQHVELTDCIFENLNDTATLSELSDKVCQTSFSKSIVRFPAFAVAFGDGHPQ